ncbi:unnamed protein product [Closterium sp. Yama58-4]|nr:unnamed protein product [Closterium sp. Yama58-4]
MAPVYSEEWGVRHRFGWPSHDRGVCWYIRGSARVAVFIGNSQLGYAPPIAMLGNACEACGLEHVDDNTLQSHVSKNVKCRRKIQHSRAQRLVEAYRDALRARRAARPRSPARSCRSYGGDAAERAAVDPAAVTDQPDPPNGVEEDSDGDESVMSVIDDGFNTLIELYIFFREADLSRREVNRLLNIFQNPNFSLRDVRRWLNFVDPSDHSCACLWQLVKKLLRANHHIAGFVTKPRKDEEDTEEVRHYSTPDTGKWLEEARAAIGEEDCIVLGVIVYSDSTHASRNGRLAAWPVLISLFNIPEALRWQEPGHVLAGVLPFPPEWASSTEKTRIFQQCMEVIFEPLLRAHRGAELRWFYVTDATGKVVKAFPCLFGQLGDLPESSRSTATLQQGSHRPCSTCYMKETHLADLSHKSVTRTVELQRRVVEAIQSATDSKAAEKIKKQWSTHPVQCYLERWNFAETTWRNVFLACAADLLHVLDGGMLPRMGKCFMAGKSKPERREFERRRKEQKKDTRASVVRIPGGTTWFSTGANYAAFEHRGMMQVMPLLIADNMEKSKQLAKAKREREVAAFVAYASFYKALVGVTKHTEKMVAEIKAAFPDQTSDWNIPKVHQIVHLIDGIPLRGMPNETSTNLWEHTHKGTVKVPVRGSNWHDIPRRIVEEEVQREIAREVAAEAGGNRQYVTALREAVRRMKPVLTKASKRAHVDEDIDAVMWAYRAAHGSDMDALAGCMVAAGIHTTTIEVGYVVREGGWVMVNSMCTQPWRSPERGGGVLVPKGTFVKASPSERWFSDIAVYRSDKEEWYARCLCIFRAEVADGEMGRHVYVKYYEAEGTCPMTSCLQLSPGRVRTRYAVVPVECIQRVVHVCKSYVNKHRGLWGLFDGTEKKPDDESDIAAWKKKDQKAFATLISRIGINLVSSVRTCIKLEASAHEAWKRLETIHVNKTLHGKILARNAFYTVKWRASKSIHEYATRVEELGETFVDLGGTVTEEDWILTLLCGLPEEWSTVITTLDSVQDTWTKETVVGRLLHEESRRRQFANESVETAMFSGGSSGGKSKWSKGATKKSYGGSDRGKGNMSNGASKCHYCGKAGHFWRECRKRPSDWTPSKARNQEGNAHTASGEADDTRESIVLLAGDGTNTPNDAWFLDTGATQHMAHSASFLTNVGAPVDVTRVVFGNGKSLPVVGVGSTRLIVDGGPVDITNVLHVPGLKVNLLSVTQLAKKDVKVTIDGATMNLF